MKNRKKYKHYTLKSKKMKLNMMMLIKEVAGLEMESAHPFQLNHINTRK